MYEKSIRRVGDYYVVRVRYPDGPRIWHWCATFNEARTYYDSLKPEIGDHDGGDCCIPVRLGSNLAISLPSQNHNLTPMEEAVYKCQ